MLVLVQVLLLVVAVLLLMLLLGMLLLVVVLLLLALSLLAARVKTPAATRISEGMRSHHELWSHTRPYLFPAYILLLLLLLVAYDL